MIAFLIHCILGSGSSVALPVDSLRANCAGAEARGDIDATYGVAQHSPPADVMYDAPGDDSVIAVGRGWKAHFAADGTQFIPFLGAGLAQDEIVHFQAASVRAGGVLISSDAVVVPVRDDDTVRYARGAVDELWQIRSENIEHVLVVSSVPAPGEIVVRCPVQTSLIAREAGDGVEFQGTFEGRTGGVRYSGAVAFDAVGHRCTLSPRWDGSAIVLTVPEEMTRALPLTIDPLIEVLGVATTPAYELAPDASIVLGPGGTYRCEVFETIWSQTDHDVTARVTRLANGAVTLHAVDATTEYWSRPKVASILDTKIESEFGIVAAVGVPSGMAREVRARELHLHFTPPPNLGPVVTIGAGGGGDHHSPDVGGDPFNPGGGSFSRFLVVWERDDGNGDSDILAAALIGDSAFTLPPIAADPVMDDQSPRLSKSDGTLTWCVVWERHAAVGNSDIWSSTVQWDFSVITAPLAISTAPEDERNPSVSSQGLAGFVIAYQRDLSGQNDVMLQVLTASTVGPPVDLTLLEGGTHASLEQQLPVVDGNSTGYLVACKESDPVGVGFLRTRFTAFLLSPTLQIQTSEVHVPLGGPTMNGTSSNVCSEAASTDMTVSRFELVWDELAQSTSSDVQAAIWVPGTSSGSVVAGCFGDGSNTSCPCGGNGGTPAGCPSSVQPQGAELLWSGQPSVAHDTFVVHATRLPQNGLGWLAQGTLSFSPAHLYGDGLLCLGGTQRRIAMRAVNASGELMYPASTSDAAISVTGGVPAGGATRVYQVVYRNIASFCTSATWNSTNALEVSWAP